MRDSPPEGQDDTDPALRRVVPPAPLAPPSAARDTLEDDDEPPAIDPDDPGQPDDDAPPGASFGDPLAPPRPDSRRPTVRGLVPLPRVPVAPHSVELLRSSALTEVADLASSSELTALVAAAEAEVDATQDPGPRDPEPADPPALRPQVRSPGMARVQRPSAPPGGPRPTSRPAQRPSSPSLPGPVPPRAGARVQAPSAPRPLIRPAHKPVELPRAAGRALPPSAQPTAIDAPARSTAPRNTAPGVSSPYLRPQSAMPVASGVFDDVHGDTLQGLPRSHLERAALAARSAELPTSRTPAPTAGPPPPAAPAPPAPAPLPAPAPPPAPALREVAPAASPAPAPVSTPAPLPAPAPRDVAPMPSPASPHPTPAPLLAPAPREVVPIQPRPAPPATASAPRSPEPAGPRSLAPHPAASALRDFALPRAEPEPLSRRPLDPSFPSARPSPPLQALPDGPSARRLLPAATYATLALLAGAMVLPSSRGAPWELLTQPTDPTFLALAAFLLVAVAQLMPISAALRARLAAVIGLVLLPFAALSARSALTAGAFDGQPAMELLWRSSWPVSLATLGGLTALMAGLMARGTEAPRFASTTLIGFGAGLSFAVWFGASTPAPLSGLVGALGDARFLGDRVGAWSAVPLVVLLIAALVMAWPGPRDRIPGQAYRLDRLSLPLAFSLWGSALLPLVILALFSAKSEAWLDVFGPLKLSLALGAVTLYLAAAAASALLPRRA